MVYTRAMFVAPGLQRVMHGKGDVEGFRVVYDVQPDGNLALESAVADDGTHDTVYLDAAEVMSLDPKRPTFYSTVWSHQLGGHGLRSASQLAYRQCFGPGHLRPLPESIAHDFALAGRAPPAHVEALGGRILGGPTQIAKAPAKSSPRL
jgi:hypothetical protein